MPKRKEEPDPLPFSLSRYFPKNTEYFYGYPAEEDSHFFNGVSPEIEEIVAARPLVCAGPNVKVFCFKSTVMPSTWRLLHDEMGTVSIRPENILAFSKKIDHHVKGTERNKKLKQALARRATPGKLVMAQPYLDARLKKHYEIPSNRIIWLNDKKNMPSYIPKDLLPAVYDEFLDGRCFQDSHYQLPLPCVVKVSSSSSGDGVRICKTERDIARAKKTFSKLEGIIQITEFIPAIQNFGVQFGIPSDPLKPIEIINWHEQLVDDKGSFIGGIIEKKRNLSPFKPLEKILLEKILPEVRRKGWYGIGGFDILMTKENKFYFVDPNFRMTGMSVYDCLYRNGDIKKNLFSFMGTFVGTESEFRRKIIPIARKNNPDQILYITALTRHEKLFRFNAALLYQERAEILPLIKLIIKLGVRSSVFKRF